jgi:hypothetical protein
VLPAGGRTILRLAKGDVAVSLRCPRADLTWLAELTTAERTTQSCGHETALASGSADDLAKCLQ